MKRPFSGCGGGGGIAPKIVAGEADVLPTHRRQMGDELAWRILAVGAEMVRGALHI